MEQIALIFLVGGIGSRFGGETPKQFCLLKDKPLALYSLQLLKKTHAMNEICVVCDPKYHKFFEKEGVTLFAEPGKLRQDSVYNGFSALKKKSDYLLIHDGARPLLDPNDVQKLIHSLRKFPAATLASPISSTVKRADHKGIVQETVPRDNLWMIHTPQAAHFTLFEKALKKMKGEEWVVTDDVSLMEKMGHDVQLVQTTMPNIKVTYPKDLKLVEAYV